LHLALGSPRRSEQLSESGWAVESIGWRQALGKEQLQELAAVQSQWPRLERLQEREPNQSARWQEQQREQAQLRSGAKQLLVAAERIPEVAGQWQ
jgi:hypothetical protein